MKLNRMVPVALLAGLLAGCGEPTLEELKADPELLDETLASCRGEAAPDKEELCQRARRAAAERFGSQIKDVMQGFVGGLKGEE